MKNKAKSRLNEPETAVGGGCQGGKYERKIKKEERKKGKGGIDFGRLGALSLHLFLAFFFICPVQSIESNDHKGYAYYSINNKHFLHNLLPRRIDPSIMLPNANLPKSTNIVPMVV